MSINKVLFEQPDGNTGVNHDNPSAALHVTQESAANTQPIVKLESPDPQISFIDSNNPGYDLHLRWNGSTGHGLRWFMDDDYNNPHMVLTAAGQLGIGVQPVSLLHVVGSGSIARQAATFQNQGTGGNDYCEIVVQNDGADKTVLGSIGTNYGAADWTGSSYLYNTGVDRDFYLKAQKNLVLFAGGTTLANRRMMIKSDGNVGIGTMSPSDRLNVTDNHPGDDVTVRIHNTSTTDGSTSSLRFTNTSGTNYDHGYITTGRTPGPYMQLGVADSVMAMHIDSTGNVGIGTTDPSGHLEVSSGASQGTSFYLNNTNDSNTNSNWRLHADTNGDFNLGVQSSSYYKRLTIDPTGKVGIGTSSPGAKLEVHTESDSKDATYGNLADSLLLRNTSDMVGAGPKLIFYNANKTGSPTSTPSALIGLQRVDNASHRGNMVFYTRGTSNPEQRMIIDSDGKVGIGTSAPQRLLTIRPTSGNNDYSAIRTSLGGTNEDSYYTEWMAAAGFKVYRGSGTSGNITIGIDTPNNAAFSGPGGNINFCTNSSGTYAERMRIRKDGNVGIGTTTPTNLLDIRGDGHSKVLVQGGGNNAVGIQFTQMLETNPPGGFMPQIWQVQTEAGSNDLQIRNATSGTVVQHFNGTGHVGINTTDPKANLHVGGTILANNQIRATGWFSGSTSGHGLGAEIGVSSGIGYLMTYNRAAGTYGETRIQTTNSRVQVKNDNNGTVEIGANSSTNTNAMTFQSTPGRLGINKTSPEYTVDVNGDINLSGRLMKNGSEQTLADTSGFIRKSLGNASYYTADAWIEITGSGNHGIHWSGTNTGSGWHIFPSSQRDMRFRSGTNNVGLRLESNDGVARGYVYANSSNQVGFLDENRSWNFKIQNQRIEFGDGQWNTISSTAGQTNMHFNGHDQFWIGAGNGTWFTGAANTKTQASGFAGATYCHDLLITTMPSTSTYDRGITFAVDTGGQDSGYRLGKWHSGDAKDSSKLVVDGQIFAKGGYTDEYDYYGNAYSTYYSTRGGRSHWTGDTEYGWNDPSIVSSSAIQIQSGNDATNSRKPQLQFHQYGYGGPAIEYDGPGKHLDIIAPTSRLSNTTGLRFRGQTVYHSGNMPGGLTTATGDYGSVKVTSTKGGYAGYAINDDWVFMSSVESSCGIYNDTNNKWSFICRQNAETELFHAGVMKLETSTTGITIAGAIHMDTSTDQKIVLQGSTNPYIRFREGTTDRGYIQWHASNNGFLFRNLEHYNFNFRGIESTNGCQLNMQRGNGTTLGSFYGSSDGIGVLDADSQWAVQAVTDSTVKLRVNNNDVFVAGVGGVSGDYGTVETKGSGKGNWEGYSINGRAVFMHDGGTGTGIYNDVNNQWMFHGYLNGSSSIRHAGATKIETMSTGVDVTGAIQLNDGNTKIEEGSGNAIRLKTNSGYCDIGPQNTAHCHIYTDRTNFYFNKTALYANSTSNPIWHGGNDGSGSGLDADKLDGFHASSFVQVGNNSSLNGDSRNTRGVTRLYRRDGNSDYSVQTSWTGSYWLLRGYSGDNFHGECMVNYASNAGNADTVDSLNASSFLRSDAADTATGTLTVRDIKIQSGYHLQRSSHNSGHLEGSYNNIGANSYKTNPIYTIGSSYNPEDASLNNMYGVGFTHTNASFIGFGSTAGWGMYVASDGDARVWLNGSDGTGYFSSNITAYASDQRLKTNIKPVQNALDKVCQLRGVEFDWVDDITSEYDFHPSTMHETGVIAQEVEKVIPDAVKTAPMNDNYTVKCGEDHNFLTVQHDKIVPVLIEAVKEQQKQIESQQKRIDELESKLNNI